MKVSVCPIVFNIQSAPSTALCVVALHTPPGLLFCDKTNSEKLKNLIIVMRGSLAPIAGIYPLLFARERTCH